MSGLEVVGAVASIVQLAQITGKLVICLRDLSDNVRRSSERFQNYKQRADELQQIVTLMKENDQLQSDALRAPIDALVRTVEAILRVLAKKFVTDPSNPSTKWRNRLKGARIPQAEALISAKFDDLERHKSTLALAILENLGGSIHRIDARLATGIPDIQSQVQRIESTLLACSTLGDHRLPSDCCLSTAREKRTALEYAAGNEEEPSPGHLSARSTGSTTLVSGRHSAPDLETGHYSQHIECSRQKEVGTRLYTENTSLERALQLNGNVGIDQFGDQNFNSHWSNNSATGQSKQVNGDVFDADFATMFFSRR
ncbi:uncharacterized protein BKCO1_4700050 [Diplodia corticola]|uniref:Fungal N-terminal domain-containing protein n=1 Tax=Diplodia corticola TaxID=236234 RepID=A0A1J9RVF3_9PEZI|nr:uncharacterized protein BKCO1_4700050 [Diplodia corticola]OJD31477.1 hypothetical protein BKCO1_4700050 [Diplodia corticola]